MRSVHLASGGGEAFELKPLATEAKAGSPAKTEVQALLA
jgi:hypothetical protein